MLQSSCGRDSRRPTRVFRRAGRCMADSDSCAAASRCRTFEAAARGAPEACRRAREGRARERDESVLFHRAGAVSCATSRSSSRTVDAVLAVHPDDLSLKYRMLAFQPTYSGRSGARSHRPGNRLRRSAPADGTAGGPERQSRRRLSRAHARARAAARQRLDHVRAGEHHIFVRAIRRCAGAVRQHPRESCGNRTRSRR